MKMYKFLFFLLTICNKVCSQVNLQTGAPSISIPLYSYSQSNGKLNTAVSLSYTGGNGIRVDDQASEVGLGWTLNVGGVVMRIQVGEPDDQLQKDITSSDHIRAGLFHKPSLPTGNTEVFKIGWAPTYEEGSENSYYDPNVHYDREHDEFSFAVNGKSGRFILGTGVDKTPLLFNPSGVRIKTVEQTPTGNINGTIAGFLITDEDGIQYKFFNPLLSSILNYVKSCYVETKRLPIISIPTYETKCNPNVPPRNNIPINNNYVTKDKQFEIFVPKESGYYIANLWFLSEIYNPITNEKIEFVYDEKEYKANKDFTASSITTDYHTPGSPSQQWTLNITENYESIKYPQLKEVLLPLNQKIIFTYGLSRKDQIGKTALTNIAFYSDGNIQSSYDFSYKYFYKSEIVNEQDIPLTASSKSVSLCLKAIKKNGLNGSSANPTFLDYYTGIQGDQYVTFRERFNLSKDYWGYNNTDGVFSAAVTQFGTMINMALLDEYLYNPSQHRNPTSDINLLQVGMLKSMTTEFGGQQEYVYEPNVTDLNGTEILSGGLRVKEVVFKEGSTNNVEKKLFSYKKADGINSSYGYEKPNMLFEGRGLWILPNRIRYKNYSPIIFSYFMGSLPGGEYVNKAISFAKTLYTYTSAARSNPVEFFQSQMRSIATSGAIKSATNGAIKLLGQPQVATAFYLYSGLKATGLFTTTGYHTYDLKTYSYNMNPINSVNYIFPQYSAVQVSSKGISDIGQVAENGKVIHEFYSIAETPLLFPQLQFPFSSKQRKLDWAYGLPKTETVLNRDDKIISEKKYYYRFTSNINTESRYESAKPGSPLTLISPDDPSHNETFTNYSGYMTPEFVYDNYSPITGKAILDKTIEKQYTSAGATGAYLEAVTDYTYDNETNALKTTVSNSNGVINEQRNYYNIDYTIPGVLSEMTSKNILSAPVSTEVWQTKPGKSPELMSASVIEYGKILNNDYRSVKNYSLQTDKPVPQAVIGVFNPNVLVRNPAGTPLILPQSELKYNGAGNLVQTKNLETNSNSTVLYSYNHQLPVASVTNAKYSDVAYTSFEKGGGYAYPDPNCGWTWDGKWEASGNVNMSLDDVSSPTGKSCAQLASPGAISLSSCQGIIIDKSYKLTLWANSNAFTVNQVLQPSYKSSTINGWTYYEYDLPSGSSLPVITGSCKIDELRLYPASASMATTTYEPGIGKTSECDANNRIVYYEYDGLGRLIKVLDEKRNIVKTYEYHTKN